MTSAPRDAPIRRSWASVAGSAVLFALVASLAGVCLFDGLFGARESQVLALSMTLLGLRVMGSPLARHTAVLPERVLGRVSVPRGGSARHQELVLFPALDVVRLYDLSADPEERHDLAEIHPERVEAALSALARFHRERGLDPESYGL